MSSNHLLQPYWDLTLANIKSDILAVALEQHWFDLLDLPQTSFMLAKKLKLNQKNTGYYLNILWSMGLLEYKQKAQFYYQNTPLTQRYFCSQSTNYIGDAWLFRRQTLRNVGQQLSKQIMDDFIPQLVEPDILEKNWANAASKQIAQEQQAVTKHAALVVLKSLPEFLNCRTLLDLGGGPGFVAIELLKANPLLNGVVFDFPDTVNIAKHNIEQAALTNRLSVIGGNLINDSITGSYDLIWCSSVLHFMPDIDAVIAKIYSALAPGGIFVSAHAEIPTSSNDAQRILPYYLSMQMQGRQLLQSGMLAKLLAKVGFKQIEQQDNVTFAVAPVSVIIARKETICVSQ